MGIQISVCLSLLCHFMDYNYVKRALKSKWRRYLPFFFLFSTCILGGFESEYFLGFSHGLSLQCTFHMEVQSLHTSINFMNVNLNFQVQCLLASLACKTFGVANFWRTIGGASWLWMDLALSPAQSSRLLTTILLPWLFTFSW